MFVCFILNDTNKAFFTVLLCLQHKNYTKIWSKNRLTERERERVTLTSGHSNYNFNHLVATTATAVAVKAVASFVRAHNTKEERSRLSSPFLAFKLNGKMGDKREAIVYDKTGHNIGMIILKCA